MFCEDGFIGQGYYIMFLTLVYGDLGFCGCICLHILVYLFINDLFQALDCSI
jgi:hypothetical protein